MNPRTLLLVLFLALTLASGCGGADDGDAGNGAGKLFYMGLDNATPVMAGARLVNCGAVVSGGDVYVLWGDGPLPAAIAGPVTVTDIYGEATAMDATDITLTATPVYVEAAPAAG